MTGDPFGLLGGLGLGGFQRREPLATPSPLEVGKLYTCSPNVLTGDRSWSGTVWEVVSFNALHACVKWAGGETWPWLKVEETRLLCRLEHQFDEAPASFVSAGGPV